MANIVGVELSPLGDGLSMLIANEISFDLATVFARLCRELFPESRKPVVSTDKQKPDIVSVACVLKDPVDPNKLSNLRARFEQAQNKPSA